MSTNNKKVAVVIPHFQSPLKLEIALTYLKNQNDVEVEVFIHDNSKNNLLFTQAINIGLRKYSYSNDYDFILILNQDANLYPDCLGQMLFAMKQSPNVGICAPISLSADKSVNWAGSAEAFPWGRHFSCNLISLPREPFATHWVNGACMLLRTAMVREIGLLDENMRFICSDADYSFTARSRGWRCLVVPSAFVEHEFGGSVDTQNAWLNKVKLEDQLYFANKWITGALYRQLSFEGSKLTAKEIQTVLMETQRQIELYTGQLSKQ